MYEWSKGIIEKISNANCLDENELRMVEISLRTTEVHERILNEAIGVSNKDDYELRYKMDCMGNRNK